MAQLQQINNAIALNSWEPDYNQLNEEIIAGPQREVLELIHEINRALGTNMKVTKTFRFSPGFYDELRKGYTKRVYELQKKRPLTTFVNAQENNRWFRRRTNDKLLRLDSLVKERRQSKIVFSNNANHAERAFELIKGLINKEIANLESYPIDFRFEIADINFPNSDITSKHILLFCKLDPYDLNYIVNQNMTYKIPMFETEIVYKMDLIKAITSLISLLVSKDEDYCFSDQEIRSRLGHHINVEVAGYYEGSEKYEVHHPYIAKSEYWNSRTFEYNNRKYQYACHGQFDVLFKFSQLKLDELAHYTLQWMSSFVNRHTNPLNNMNTVFNGYHMWMDNDFKDLHNTDPNNCNIANREVQNDAYCDDTRCLNRKACDFYLEHNGLKPTNVNPDPKVFTEPESAPLETALADDREMDNLLAEELRNIAQLENDVLDYALDRIREINSMSNTTDESYTSLISAAIDDASGQYNISRHDVITLIDENSVGGISRLLNTTVTVEEGRVNVQEMTDEERTLAFVARNGGQAINFQQTREER